MIVTPAQQTWQTIASRSTATDSPIRNLSWVWVGGLHVRQKEKWPAMYRGGLGANLI